MIQAIYFKITCKYLEVASNSLSRFMPNEYKDYNAGTIDGT